MPTNSELLDNAMSRLGQRTSQKIRADLLYELNNVIKTLEAGTFFPWFLEGLDTLGVVADDTFVALPADFALEVEEARPYFTLNGEVYYLKKTFFALLQGKTNTDMRFYALQGGQLHFRGAATEAVTINFPYYKKTGGGVVDDGLEVSNLWLLNVEEWVVNEALTRVAAFHVRDSNKAAEFATLAQKAKKEAYIYHESRIHTSMDYEVGGATDGS